VVKYLCSLNCDLSCLDYDVQRNSIFNAVLYYNILYTRRSFRVILILPDTLSPFSHKYKM